MRAVALTDHANLFGAIRHWKKCRSAGLLNRSWAPSSTSRAPDGRGVVDHIVVLAATSDGYQTWCVW